MVQLHIIILASVIAVFIAFSLIMWVVAKRQESKNRYDGSGAEFIAKVGGIFSIIFIVVFIAGLAPFNPKYWMITPETGTVTKIQTQTVLTGSNSNSQLTPRFVLALDNGMQVIMDDPRVQSVKVGDSISLNCTVEFIYAGKDKVNCILN